MKKTIIALAALAATQFTFAQVTVSGSLGFGFNKIQPISNPASAGTTGMQMTDGEINFKAVEDLGGGFKVTINSAVSLKGRDSQVYAKDATIAFLTPVGQITMGSVDTDAEYPRAFAGAKIVLPSDKQVAGGDHADVLAFTTKLGPVYTTVAYTEVGSQDICDLAIALGDAKNACNPAITPFGKQTLAPGLAVPILNGGTAANLVPGGPGPGKGPAQVTSLTGSYEEGPLSLGLTVSSYSVSGGAVDKAGIALFKSAYDGRVDTAFSVAYDARLAKVGFGYNKRGKGWGDETFAGILVPVGAFSFGLTYEQKADDSKSLGEGVTAGSYASGALVALLGAGDPSKLPQANLGDFLPTLIAADLKGTAKRTKIRFGIDYAFSKLTSLNLSYGAYEYGEAERAITALGKKDANVKTDEYQLRLLKQF